jgi:AcrR family transcriptional regulator
MAKPKQNLHGQELGAKGMQTRARILKATATLLEKRPLRELKVAEIGALSGLSYTTFYIYFESVADAALAVVEELNQATPEVMEILDRPWTHDNVVQNCRAFVQAYISFWDHHHALLAVRNFAADEGDRRFFDARRRTIEPIHYGLQAKITHFQEMDAEAPKLHVPSTVSVLLAMLERTASVIRHPSAHRATRPRQIESAAFLLASTMICRCSNGGDVDKATE